MTTMPSGKSYITILVSCRKISDDETSQKMGLYLSMRPSNAICYHSMLTLSNCTQQRRRSSRTRQISDGVMNFDVPMCESTEIFMHHAFLAEIIHEPS
jgi:hypothetical protein